MAWAPSPSCATFPETIAGKAIGKTLDAVRYVYGLFFCYNPTISEYPTPEVCHQRWEETQPKPLPTTRKRSLSLPLPRLSMQQTCDQRLSPLFRLPPEIRSMIYRDVLGGNDFHLAGTWKRLGYVKCREENKKEFWHHECYQPRLYKGYCNTPMKHATLPQKSPDQQLLPLLKTCRRIYTEAVGVLYSQNTFLAQCPDDILHLSQTLLPQRLNSITSLALYWPSRTNCYIAFNKGDFHTLPHDILTWKKTWEIIGQMKGLRYLRVFVNASATQDAESEAKILEPLRTVVGPKVFEVDVSWVVKESATNIPSVYSTGDPSYVPYRLTRNGFRSSLWGLYL
ncbi:hypothetical protein MMC13_008069 [Lambiella insularis]|nr:hypothetical protein [Lambiella insularis]